jgi:hypothetical protein
MKKIVCPHCGAINLEKFLTFPHCAGCSALLPALAPPTHIPFWRRPLRVWLGVILLGTATLGLLAAASIFAIGLDEPSHLMVYATTRPPRRDGIATCRFWLEPFAAQGNSTRSLRGVSIRLPRGFERSFEILSVQPAPDSLEKSGGALNYKYRRWPVEQVWEMRVRLRRRCPQHLSIAVGAERFYTELYQATVQKP